MKYYLGSVNGLATDVALNCRTLAVIGYKRNNTNSHYLVDLGTNRTECRYRLSGEISIELGTWLFRQYLKGIEC